MEEDGNSSYRPTSLNASTAHSWQQTLLEDYTQTIHSTKTGHTNYRELPTIYRQLPTNTIDRQQTRNYETHTYTNNN